MLDSPMFGLDLKCGYCSWDDVGMNRKRLLQNIVRSVGLLAVAHSFLACGADRPLPKPAIDAAKSAQGKQVAVFAGGCFWCTEAVFELIRGVDSVISGYAGGDKKSANYQAVGSGSTKHAESIQITYDPSKVTYGELLMVFFGSAHDPTQLDRQGPDYGKQYRSAIFYSNDEQKRIAEAYIKQLEEAKIFPRKIVTQVGPLSEFFVAEGYHQDYVKNNPGNGYVIVNSIPKVKKTKALFPDLLK